MTKPKKTDKYGTTITTCPTIHRQLKIECAKRGLTVRQATIEAFKNWLSASPSPKAN